MNRQLVLLDQDKDLHDSKNDLNLSSNSNRSHYSQRQTLNDKNEVNLIPFQRHDRRITQKSEKTEQPAPIIIEKEASKPISPEKEPPKKNIVYRIIKRIVDSNYFIAYMTLLTLIALFSNDIQAAWLPKYVDNAFDILQTLLLFFFSLEILLTCIANREYINSFFFWLDVISTLSLIQDISFIFDRILNGDTG